MRNGSFGKAGIKYFDRLLMILRFRKVKPYLYNCHTLLEVGCGYKAKLLSWVQQYYKIEKLVGMDLAVDTKLRNPTMNLLSGNANEPIPIETNSVDIIVSMALLEHLQNPAGFLSEVYRILKKGGTLILTTPSPKAKPVLELLAYKLHLVEEEEIRDHVDYYKLDKLKQMLVDAGFEQQKVQVSSFTFGFNNFAYCKK